MVFLSIELAVIGPQRRDSIKQKIDIGNIAGIFAGLDGEQCGK
jgi:hypothetical protein